MSENAGPKSGRPDGRTTGRAELAKNPRFAQISPQVGALDEDALVRALSEDPDAALALLADLMTATDEELRRAAHRVAARLVLDHCRTGVRSQPGVSRPFRVPASRGGDLELDSSMDAVVAAFVERRPVSLDELVARDWGRAGLALCLLVDCSGSMHGARLAAAAVTAAACAIRAPGEHAVLAFAKNVRVLKSMSELVPSTRTVDQVLRLRGHGTTSLGAALDAAGEQLASARARRQVVVLLSDCRATDDVDPVPRARALPELVVLGPADDSAEASRLATDSGARFGALEGASAVPGLLDRLLS